MRLPTAQRLAGLTCARSGATTFRPCETVAFTSNTASSTTTTITASSYRTRDGSARSQHRVLRTASQAHLKSGIRRSPLQWSHIAHTVRNPDWKPVVSSGMAGDHQIRGHGGHEHHHHHHDNTYLTSSNKSDPGVRITRLGLYVNLGMAIAKGAGGYVFNSQA